MAIAAFAAVAVVGAAVQSKNAKDAAKGAAASQERQGNLSLSENKRQFDLNRSDLAVSREAGDAATLEQRALLGLSGKQAGEEAFARFNESPGQQFLRNRGQRALLRNSAAIGGIGGGNVRTALVDQGVGFAQQDFNNQFNRLSAIRQGGQAAIAQGVQAGNESVRNISNIRNNIGQARASGILGVAQAKNKFIGSTVQAVGTAFGGAR